jgi:hypothetical protein
MSVFAKDHTKSKDISHFSIYLWIEMARNDLNVAKLEQVSAFIRCYHAQQAMEKMLKTAFVVLAGRYHEISDKLITERGSGFSNKLPYNVPNCAWELEDIKFPTIHNLVALWDKLGEYDRQAFGPLTEEQKDFMNKATKCATEYRYPYFSRELGIHRCVSDIDTKEVVQAADLLFNDIYEYICRKTIVCEAGKTIGD